LFGASRESNGITVSLLWSRATNLVAAAVNDVTSDEYFELVLDDDESALEVFNLEVRTRRPEPEMLRDAA
jgi:hypothetical protein